MKQCIYVAAGATLVALAAAQGNGCAEEKGNWYCNEVKAVTYTGFGSAGSYNQVVNMANGQCDTKPFSFAGGMAPLDGEVSWHFRGPMRLKQFAYYTPGSKSANKHKRHKSQHRRQGHNHAHQHLHDRAAEPAEQREVQERGVGDWVTATINGQVVSWINSYDGGAKATSAPVPVPNVAAATTGAAASTASVAAPVANNVGVGNWGRQAYYNAEKKTAEGLVFMNNRWDGALQFVAADGLTGSSSPQTLADVQLGDDKEISIFTSTKCSGSNCAGAFRTGTEAYQGFSSASKLFLLEFVMPLSGTRGSNNADMPAAWILNAQIPRTGQYDACSCWASGCGEWDIYEVLDSGNTKCKSTFHGGIGKGGGASEWFQRPTNAPVKVAVWFDGTQARGQGHIFVLPDSTSFDDVLADSLLSGLVQKVVGATKVFPLGS